RPANSSALLFNSLQPRLSPSYTTTTRSGVFSTCSSNSFTMVFSRGYHASVWFHSSTTCRRSASPSSGNSHTRCCASSAIPSNNRSQCPTNRSIVPASNRSVLYSTTPVSPSSLSHIVTLNSNFASCRSISSSLPSTLYRASNTSNAASSVMNNVAPSFWLTCFNFSVTSRLTRNSCCAPR